MYWENTIKFQTDNFIEFHALVKNYRQFVKDNRSKLTISPVLIFIDNPYFLVKEIGKLNPNNLFIEVKLTLQESLCGFEKTFTHLDGKHFKFTMNESVRHGDIYVMKGLGMPYFNEDKYGDLIIKLNVEHFI